MSDKRWVVLRYSADRYDVVADYGDYAWGSVLYEVLGYWPTQREAREAIHADLVLSR
jgi:hypothetical protein